MATDDELPSEHIKRILLERPEACVDVSVALLRVFSESLGNIIGDDGFKSLLLRAARRVAIVYPWVQFNPPAGQAASDLDWFRRCFEGQAVTEVQDASVRLFTGLVDILTSLIGGRLTTIILENAVDRASASKKGKEQNNG